MYTIRWQRDRQCSDFTRFARDQDAAFYVARLIEQSIGALTVVITHRGKIVYRYLRK